MNGRETPANKTVRLSLEAKIKDFYTARDMTQVNALLDVYPNNRERPQISMEQAQHIAMEGMKQICGTQD